MSVFDPFHITKLSDVKQTTEIAQKSGMVKFLIKKIVHISSIFSFPDGIWVLYYRYERAKRKGRRWPYPWHRKIKQRA